MGFYFLARNKSDDPLTNEENDFILLQYTERFKKENAS